MIAGCSQLPSFSCACCATASSRDDGLKPKSWCCGINSTCRFQKLDTCVPVMQSAQDCMCDDVPEAVYRAPVRRILSERNMRTPPIIIGGEFRKNPPKVFFVEHDQMIGALAPDRPDQTFNMAILPFCQGERNDVGRSRMPIAWMRRVNMLPKARSLSRTMYAGALSQGNASVIWRANHSAVGCRVTANHNNCRRPWPKIRNAKSCTKAIVGTTKRSIDAIPSAWL